MLSRVEAVDCVTDGGDTALQLATYSNKAEIIELLLNAGVTGAVLKYR